MQGKHALKKYIHQFNLHFDGRGNHLFISKGSKCKGYYELYKEKKDWYHCLNLGDSYCDLKQHQYERDPPKHTLSSLATFIFNVILMLLWGVFKS